MYGTNSNNENAPSYIRKQDELVKYLDDYLSEIIKSDSIELLPLSEQLHSIFLMSKNQLKSLIQDSDEIKARSKQAEDIRLQLVLTKQKKAIEEENLKAEQEQLRALIESNKRLEEECQILKEQVVKGKEYHVKLKKRFRHSEVQFSDNLTYVKKRVSSKNKGL